VAKRDARGRWLPGQSANPGGRTKVKKDYLESMRAVATPAKWRAICGRAIEDAIQGDAHARRWLSDYLLGRPSQAVSLSGDIGVTMMTLDEWIQRAEKRMEEAED